MNKHVLRYVPALMAISAIAQEKSAEAPQEHASGLTVVLFLVLFVGTCVVYGWYAWWSGRKAKQDGIAHGDEGTNVTEH